MSDARADFTRLLVDLVTADIDFIVIGGVAASLQGAPIYTTDLDIVHARDRANVERLTDLLNSHGAYYREHPERKPPPDVNHMQGPGHHLLSTDAGPVDILGAIGQEQSFQKLLPDTVHLEIAPDVHVRVRPGYDERLSARALGVL